ncbi:MAG: NTP transferase domain-containing protein [Candidatus Pacebacteria bacterium]|jgi:mannose-1-phosphate guanylyltransferase|nr:NTP transferase domain-containing protein [Candidatus Paceibacterota bacterium]MBT4652074.1 NTP transferase domain-containing protein [Candidatus Paceibacterota bacterium]MBT6756096.1 NTP transferase domain-containing protein [Candidatus Paceibacterota bacterium]MBT6921689.1 NTP transferase domain-containing protein [Candidatus Paceibacterota bacterium]
MNINPHTYAVILAGGGGTRLWPKSRTKTPKQFLKLVGQKTMIQIAADRVAKLVDWKKIIVVTNKIYSEEVKKQLPLVPVENIIAEPEKKDTALAMLVGALFAKSKDPKAIIINAASDHTVTDEPEFVRVMQSAIEVAAEEKDLLTVGILPTYPTSAFGYIKTTTKIKDLGEKLPLFKVDSFTEKPDTETAKKFIATKKYFWNANMYVWSAVTLKESFATHKPSLFEKTKHLDSLTPAEFHEAINEVYKDAEAISIDYAISEKADNLLLIPGDFGWSDVGDWKVVYDLGNKDHNTNVVVGSDEKVSTVTVNSTGNLIHTNGKLVALIGLEDMIVVDTDEILMVCPKEKSQDVKKIVNKLKTEKRKEYL